MISTKIKFIADVEVIQCIRGRGSGSKTERSYYHYKRRNVAAYVIHRLAIKRHTEICKITRPMHICSQQKTRPCACQVIHKSETT